MFIALHNQNYTHFFSYLAEAIYFLYYELYDIYIISVLEPQDKKINIVETNAGKKDSTTQTADKPPPPDEKEKKTAKTIIQEAVQKGMY